MGHVDPKVEQLGPDVIVVRNDLNQLIDEVPGGKFTQLITVQLKQGFTKITVMWDKM